MKNYEVGKRIIYLNCRKSKHPARLCWNQKSFYTKPSAMMQNLHMNIHKMHKLGREV